MARWRIAVMPSRRDAVTVHFQGPGSTLLSRSAVGSTDVCLRSAATVAYSDSSSGLLSQTLSEANSYCRVSSRRSVMEK